MLLQGLKRFHESVYPRYEHAFRALADRQQPKAMFITCSDSRIDPTLLLQCDPGELFVCRNAGNFVPLHESDTSGVAAAVEYAVDVLGIEHLIVCGHSDCGAMKGVLNPQAVASRRVVSRWLHNGETARRIAEQAGEGLSDQERLRLVTEENVTAQLMGLALYPCVAAAFARGAMNLYGWYYDIGEGRVHCFDPARRQFLPFDGTVPRVSRTGVQSAVTAA